MSGPRLWSCDTVPMSLHPSLHFPEQGTPADGVVRRRWPSIPVSLGLVGLGTGLATLLTPAELVAVAVGGIVGVVSCVFTAGWRPVPAVTTPDGQRDSGKGQPQRLGPAAVDPAMVLVDAGVVHDDPTAPDTVLDGSFASAWLARATDLCRGGESGRLDALARVASVPRGSVSLSTFDGGAVAWLDGERLGAWESTPALCLDLAGLETLATRTPVWPRLDVAARGHVAGALRLLAEQCPACGGAVAVDDVPLPGRGHTAFVRVGCVDCDVTLQELSIDVCDLRDER